MHIHTFYAAAIPSTMQDCSNPHNIASVFGRLYKRLIQEGVHRFYMSTTLLYAMSLKHPKIFESIGNPRVTPLDTEKELCAHTHTHYP